MTSTVDEPVRCFWCGETELYRHYHDTEWGFPVGDDTRLFEKLCLESFQSGLSWITILKKREAFRQAFAGFDMERMARFTEGDVERLLGDAGIVRHRGKIEAVLRNARCALQLRDEAGSLAAYVWRYEASPTAPAVISETAESRAMARDLKKRGWSFVGPTTVYAFMQSMGLVNDHSLDCHVREAALLARRHFIVPT